MRRKHFGWLSLLIPLGVLASCARQPIVGGTFTTSFEANDPLAIENDNVSKNNVNDLTTVYDTGPNTTESYNIKGDSTNGYGFTGLKSFSYDANIVNDGAASFKSVIYDNLDVKVGDNTVFSYKVDPLFGQITSPVSVDLNFPSSYVSLDLIYTKGDDASKQYSLIDTIDPIDQYGYKLNPLEQGKGKILICGQWNSKKVDISKIAGATIKSIVLTYSNDNVKKDESIKGYIDDISIKDETKIDSSSLTNYVDTRRGTNTSFLFSRGDCIPATAYPNGFNMISPLTDATYNNDKFLYQYSAENNDNNNPVFKGISFSHEPSPWLGDRNEFNLCPANATSIDQDNIDCSPDNKGYEFSHNNEIAQPDYYELTTNSNNQIESAPTNHGGVFRFKYPNENNFGAIIFDWCRVYRPSAQFKITFDHTNNTFKGYVNGDPNYFGIPMFFYGELPKGTFNEFQSNVNNYQTPYVIFNLDDSKTFEVKIATSNISTEQAKHNLDLEINNKSFDDLHKEATNVWNQRLSAIDILSSNANDTTRTSLYSSLYRMNLYPNDYAENLNTNEDPMYYHVSPVLPKTGNQSDDYTNFQIKPGKMYVNNGFWDTYRTAWPLYQLLYPNLTQDLIDGFLSFYREGGWIPRWSDPGYTDCMDGTMSDAAFSDAYTSGVITDLDTAFTIYQSATKDAFQVSEDNSKNGRHYLNVSQYLGYTPSDLQNTESVSWTLENCIADYAIGKMAIKLGNSVTDGMARVKVGQTKQQIIDTGNFLLNKSKNYQNVFDSSIGFFRGKDQNGNWATQKGTFDPANWGYEFTESDGWNYAFSVPYDVSGLMNLYGGQTGLINKLDLFFNTVEDGTKVGTYDTSRPEIHEARQVRLGQLAINNQPAHHIPYMYAAAGLPYKTQELTREITQRLFVGSDIGQGYIGDEDNGEMSSWYILSSLGLYDLALGSGQYILTSPQFDKVTINRDNNTKITINAKDNDCNHKYIDKVRLDGEYLNDVYVNQAQLFNGNNHEFDFTMSSTSTDWANKTINPDNTTSITNLTSEGTLSSDPSVDLTDLIDCNSSSSVNLSSSNVILYWDKNKDSVSNPTGFLLTSGDVNQNYSSIQISGSNDKTTWTTLNTYENQNFENDNLSKYFKINTNTNFQYFRISIVNNSTNNVVLRQIQFLGENIH